MPNVASIGTDLPCSGSAPHRVVGDDQCAVTLAVEDVPGGAQADVDVTRVHGFFAGIQLIGDEDLGFAEPVRARVGPAHNIGDPTAVSAVTILEGPVASGR
jgi:hypothetical protein